MNNLLDMEYKELMSFLEGNGIERYRAGQISRWISRGIYAFDQMTDISGEMRQSLRSICSIDAPEIVKKLVSRFDGTTKYIFRLADGNIIESVLMKYEHGLAACLSSQAGCRMGCRFCASSSVPFARNLTSGEMYGQVLEINRDTGDKVGNVVLMGIGEPLDNYTNVIKFIRQIMHESGLNIGGRRITVSTCGIVPGILKLAGEHIPLTLSVSLHAPNDAIRNMLMPVNGLYSIDKIIEACKIYTRTGKRRVTFEYAMISGINDSKGNAMELAALIEGMLCHVNIIPVNPVEGKDYMKSSRSAAEMFQRILEGKNIRTTIRRELGSDIEAACGQLRRRIITGEPV